VEKISLKRIKSGVNYIKNFIIFKDEDTINVCKNQCKHMGGKFGNCDSENNVICNRHNWKLNLRTLNYSNPEGLKQEGLFHKIDNEELIIYEDELSSSFNSSQAKTKLKPHEFKIKFYTHACVEIIWNDKSFFTDPWLIGPAFIKGWWLLHKPPNDWLEKICSCDGIYISHNHSDHMNFPTLSKIVEKNPLIPIFVPEFESDSCYKILSLLGFQNIHRCKFGEKQELGGANFTIYQDTTGKEDSALLFEYKGYKILNTVDCKNIKSYDINDIDVLLAEFSSGASGYPVCWSEQYGDEIIEKILKRNRNQMFKNIVDTVKHFSPSVFVPFAGYFKESYWSDYKIKDNNIKNCPIKINKFVEKTFKDVKTWLPDSGVSLDIGDFSTYPYTEEFYQDKPLEYYASKIKHGPHIKAFNKKKNLEKYFDLIEFKGDLLLHIIETDEEYISCKNEFFVNFRNGDKLITSSKPTKFTRYLKIKVRSDVFRYVLYNMLPWEEFSIGFQAEFYREPDQYNFDFWNYMQNKMFTQTNKITWD